MAINAPTPTVVPAVGQITYDKYWITNMQMMAMDPSKPVRIVSTLKKARQLQNGSYEIMPDSPEVRVVIKDLYTEAEDNADLAAAINAVTAQIAAYGLEQEVL